MESKHINPFDPYPEDEETAQAQFWKRIEELDTEELTEFTEWLLDHYRDK